MAAVLRPLRTGARRVRRGRPVRRRGVRRPEPADQAGLRRLPRPGDGAGPDRVDPRRTGRERAGGHAARARPRTCGSTFGVELFGSSHWLAYRRRCEARTRAALGSAFDAAFELGAGLSIDDALALRLRAANPTPRPPPNPVTGLTQREWEVAVLVAQGFANRAIAQELHVSQRTAETHVQHILTKLGFGSRAQIANWVGERHNRAYQTAAKPVRKALRFECITGRRRRLGSFLTRVDHSWLSLHFSTFPLTPVGCGKSSAATSQCVRERSRSSPGVDKRRPAIACERRGTAGDRPTGTTHSALGDATHRHEHRSWRPSSRRPFSTCMVLGNIWWALAAALRGVTGR